MKPYNKITLGIQDGLNRVAFGTAGGYIKLLDSTVGANVRIHLNEKNADGIPLKNYHAIDAKNVTSVFVSADAVPNGTITLIQATSSQEFEMITPASDINVDEVGSYSDVALTALNKIFNPYSTPSLSQVTSTSSSNVVVLSKVLTSDKVVFSPSFPLVGSSSHHRIAIVLNGQFYHSWTCYYGSGSFIAPSNQITIEGAKGKTLTIEMITQSGYQISASLQEYTLKP